MAGSEIGRGAGQGVIPPPPDPRELLRRAGLAPKKAWGQNFLLDQEVLAEIAALAARDAPRTIVELGAGLGALTHHLARQALPVLAVERDRDLLPLLRDSLAWAPWVEVLAADAGRFDYAGVAARAGGSLTVTGNLPYQLSGRILVSLAGEPSVAAAVLLVQREVAERLVASPGGRDYGLLSVLVQRRFRGRIARIVPPAAFLPRPKVFSAVLELREQANLSIDDAALVRTARAAFSQRRKTLKNALRGALRLDSAATLHLENALRAAGIDPGVRAETFDLAAFSRLAEALQKAGLLGGDDPAPDFSDDRQT